MREIKICIGADSRAVIPVGKSWVDHFNRKYKLDPFILLKGCVYFSDIYAHARTLKEINQHFDICIIQLGLNENVIPWNLSALDCVYKDLDPNWQAHTAKAPDFANGFRSFKNCYYYFNEDLVIETFKVIRKYCDKLLYVEIPYNWVDFWERTILTNQIYGNLSDAVIKMPTDPGFPAKCTTNTPQDQCHYLETYTEELADMIFAGVEKLAT